MKKRASAEGRERDGRSSKYHLDLSIIIPPRRAVPRRAGGTSLPSEWISLRVFLRKPRSPVATHRGDVCGAVKRGERGEGEREREMTARERGRNDDELQEFCTPGDLISPALRSNNK